MATIRAFVIVAVESRSDRVIMIVLVLISLSLLAPGIVLGASTDVSDEDRSGLDRSYESVENLVEETVRGIDSFFSGEEHNTFNDRKSRIRFRLNTDYFQHHGWDVSPKVNLNLVLPGLKNRLRLVVNDQPSTDVDQPVPADDENALALRWIGKQSTRRGYSFDVGIHGTSSSIDPFARMNLGIEYALPGDWIGQTTNRLYYYAKNGVRNDFRQYFNRVLSEDLLFRSRTRLQYFEENEKNPYIEQKFSVFKSLSDTRKLAYEALYRKLSIEDSPFDADEIQVTDTAYFHHYQLRVRYRQQAWKPWFYLEFWPSVAWPEERDYDTTFGALFRIEVNLGGSDKRLDE